MGVPSTTVLSACVNLNGTGGLGSDGLLSDC